MIRDQSNRFRREPSGEIIEPLRVYSTTQVSALIGRDPRCIRAACHSGRLRARLDTGGFLIMGQALIDYLMPAAVLKTDNLRLSSKVPEKSL
jgi:hypothetical protein